MVPTEHLEHEPKVTNRKRKNNAINVTSGHVGYSPGQIESHTKYHDVIAIYVKYVRERKTISTLCAKPQAQLRGLLVA